MHRDATAQRCTANVQFILGPCFGFLVLARYAPIVTFENILLSPLNRHGPAPRSHRIPTFNPSRATESRSSQVFFGTPLLRRTTTHRRLLRTLPMLHRLPLLPTSPRLHLPPTSHRLPPAICHRTSTLGRSAGRPSTPQRTNGKCFPVNTASDAASGRRQWPHGDTDQARRPLQPLCGHPTPSRHP